MSDRLERNKRTATAFDDLIFDRSRPADGVEKDVGAHYAQHDPVVGNDKKGWIEYIDRTPRESSSMTSARVSLQLLGVLLCAGLFGCASIGSNTAILSDSSHLGTPYSGTTRDVHTLYCMGRGVMNEPASLLFFPIVLFPLVDLPLSFALDTILLPVDLALEAEARPLVVGEGGCRLIGM